jgi:hypothetical protein
VHSTTPQTAPSLERIGQCIALLLFVFLINLAAAAEAQQQPPIFVNVSQQAGIVNNRIGTEKAIGQTWGDYNNDGWRDLYVLNWGQNVLYQNVGGTMFVDITAQAGVGDESNSKAAAWGDYDQDGFVDLYVANWSCYPLCGRPSSGERDHLYHNNGNASGVSAGTFTDVTNLLAANKQYRLGYPTDPQAEEAQHLTLYGPPPEPSFYPSNLQLILAALAISLIAVTLIWRWRR